MSQQDKNRWTIMKADAARLRNIMREHTEIRLLCVGENHFTPNELSRFVGIAIPMLFEIGFTHLAIEHPTADDQLLQDFVRGRISLQTFRRSTRIRSVNSLTGQRTTISNSYCQALRKIFKAGFTITSVDIDPVINPDRDGHMRNRITEILANNPTNRIVFWSGLIHTFIRPEALQQNFRTAAELLSEGQPRNSVFNMFQIANIRRNPFAFDLIAAVMDGLRLPGLQLRQQLQLPTNTVVTQFNTTEGPGRNFQLQPEPLVEFTFNDADASYWCPLPQVQQTIFDEA